MSPNERFTLGLLVGAILISIPFMWHIENLEAEIVDLQREETPMFEYAEKMSPCQKVGRR